MGNKRLRNVGILILVWVSFLYFTTNSSFAAIDNTKIAVISDVHYYAPELGTTGSEFENYLANDRKMLKESAAILRSVVNAIKRSDAEIVLITGDLTKDGELLCHQQLIGYLEELQQAGKKVFVINGNHDINNPDAYSYSGSSKTRVPTISSSDFKQLYHNFGYDQAIAKDPTSTSYVVEPFNGLRIIAMDSCLYEPQQTAGGFSASRLAWIKDQIKDASLHKKTIIGMMHHGITEHFWGQATFFPEYIIPNANQIANEFSALGLKIVFTGHFHAQDITEKQTIFNHKNSFMLDIETGSLVSPPSPIRYVELTADNKIKISTKTIKSIDYNTNGLDFQTYAKNIFEIDLTKQVPFRLAGFMMDHGYTKAQATVFVNKQVAPPLQITVSDLLVKAAEAHYFGDEAIDPQTLAICNNMKNYSELRTIGKFVQSFRTDLYPADNNVTIDLVTGKVVD
ncbi:MAG: cyclic 3,5-adenosine monophosphate phosphodiesterase [Firmicutes bacterium]|nr:cyclic 3,5-adenosine monophosphate phosphodiesterase [Bacillota bacterium]